MLINKPALINVDLLEKVNVEMSITDGLHNQEFATLSQKFVHSPMLLTTIYMKGQTRAITPKYGREELVA
jgi:hypothetical protein